MPLIPNERVKFDWDGFPGAHIDGFKNAITSSIIRKLIQDIQLFEHVLPEYPARNLRSHYGTAVHFYPK